MRLLKTAKGWDEHDDVGIVIEVGFDSYWCVISEANVLVWADYFATQEWYSSKDASLKNI